MWCDWSYCGITTSDHTAQSAITCGLRLEGSKKGYEEVLRELAGSFAVQEEIKEFLEALEVNILGMTCGDEKKVNFIEFCFYRSSREHSHHLD